MQTIKRLICYLLAGLLISGYTLPAYAGLVGTDALIAEQAVNQDRATIISALEREDVSRLLAEYGVSQGEAQARVNALTDAEVQQLAGRIEELPVGAGTTEVLLVGVIGLLVLLILEGIGVIDIFAFM